MSPSFLSSEGPKLPRSPTTAIILRGFLRSPPFASFFAPLPWLLHLILLSIPLQVPLHLLLPHQEIQARLRPSRPCFLVGFRVPTSFVRAAVRPLLEEALCSLILLILILRSPLMWAILPPFDADTYTPSVHIIGCGG